MNHANSFNQVILIGRLGQDPTIKRSKGKNPTAFASFSMATYKKFGSGRKTTNWSHVNYWGEKSATWAAEWLKKGMLIQVNGELSTRKYTDAGGVERTATDVRAYEVIMLSKPKDAVSMDKTKEEEPAAANQEQDSQDQQGETLRDDTDSDFY